MSSGKPAEPIAPRFNLAADIRVEPVYDDFQVVIVDNALENPDELVDMAAASTGDFMRPDHGKYPGVVLKMLAEQESTVKQFYRERLQQYFDIQADTAQFRLSLNLLTDPPRNLSWAQRMCHTDDVQIAENQRAFAAVCYLFRDDRLGGTAFYRMHPGMDYRGTSAKFQRASFAARAEIIRQYPFFAGPAAYITTSNEFAELVKVVPAQWNRMLFYLSAAFHSAHITDPSRLVPSVSRGRLTLNIFGDGLKRPGS